MAGSKAMGRIWGWNSTTVTSTPHRSPRASAISRPMAPAPTTTAFSTPLEARLCLMRSAWCRSATTLTPGRFTPGRGGRTG